MKPARRRKLLMLIILVTILAVATALVLYALRQNISLFYSPAEVAAGQSPLHQMIRVGGMVVKGSIEHGKKDLSVQFKVTDFQQTITVNYKGLLPDLFRDGQGVVVRGELLDNQTLKAVEVLAKHDENYMPPEVKSALAGPKK